MANLTKTEKYVAQAYAKYFGRTADKGTIKYYESIGKTSKILKQITKDANIEQYKVHGNDLKAEVHKTFQNLFSRNADNTELEKYVKVLQKGKDLPINSIVKKATKFDKDVYKNKQEIAEFVAKNGGGVFDLSKVTKAHPIDVKSLITLDDLRAEIAKLPENDFVPTAFDGKIYTLTEGFDSGSKFVGTDKNDIFEATGTTLTAFDKIDGGAGIDTLQIIDAAGVMGTVNPVGMEIKNVEKMTVKTAGSFGQVAAAGTSAAKEIITITPTVNVAGSTNTITVTYGGVSVTTAPLDGSVTAAEVSALLTSAINAIAGSTVAATVGNQVVITAPVAGTALPTDIGAVVNTAAGDVTWVKATAQANSTASATTTAAVYDVSGIADLTDVKVTSAVNVNLKAATTTNVDVSGTTGAVQVDGGKNVTVTDAKAAVTLDNAKGNVTVTDATQDKAITINDGANVTVTTTSAVDSGDITIGGVNGNATGDVKVTQNLNSDKDLAGGNITVTGGKTVTVNVNATNTDTTGGKTITIGDITVTGDANTTAVTVNQTEAVAGSAADTAVAGVKEVASVQFANMAINDTVSLDGLIFTAKKALTAAEVAAAFANLKAGATHGQAKADDGIYSGALAQYNTGTVSADNKVVFTATEAKDITVDLSNAGTVTAVTAIVVTTQGVDAKEAKAAVGAIANGVVTIDDNATKSVTDITVDGYGANALLGGGLSGSLDKLTTLTLKNSGAAGTATLTTAVASLNLTVDDVQSTVTLTAGNLKTLNLTTTGEDSTFALSATKVETLTIAAAADLDISTSTAVNLAALKTVTISGTGDVDLGKNIFSKLETLAASAATGDISATVDGTKATVTTGSGKDTITVNSATVTQAISLGDGNDILDLSALTTVDATTAAISGGAGSDTVVLNANFADVTAGLSSLANSIIFKSKVTEFEKLEIAGATTAARDVNVGNLGYNHVILGANTTALTLSDMANNGTVVLNAAQTAGATVAVKDAATGLTDVLNVIANVNASDVNAGTLTVAKVETINITATDTLLDNNDDGIDDAVDTSTLTLVAVDATAVTVAGNANLILNNSGNTKVTSIDASKLTGNLTVTSDNATTSATIIGGSGDDNITAAYLDKVFGGAGNDTLVAADLAELTGGTGADTFVAKTATTKNSYATIKDFNKAEGDSIQFAGATKFINTKVTFASTIGFEEYLDKAASAAGANGVSWFTYTDAETGTNTYLVYNAAGVTFDVASDMVIKVAGVVDFSTAAFNGTDKTIAFA